MVRGDVLPESPELILCDHRPLLRLTAPRLQLLQHSSGRLPLPVVRISARLRVSRTVAGRRCRLVSGAVHAKRGGAGEKSCCREPVLNGELANCGCQIQDGVRETEKPYCDWLRAMEIVIVTKKV